MLLFAISFTTLHAFSLNFLDTEHCSVDEYIQEIEYKNMDELSGDVCDIHHEFHLPFLLPTTSILPSHAKHSDVPQTYLHVHHFTSPQSFLKPPIS